MGWRDTAGVKPRSSWRETAAAAVEPLDTLDSAQLPVEPEKPGMLDPSSKLGAAAQGAVQGVTLKFGDEAMAAADTAIEAGRRGLQWAGLSDKPAQTVDADPLDAPGTTEVPVAPGLADVYRKAREGYRADLKTSKATHPWVYGGSELLGGVALPLPGAGLMKGAPLLAKVGLGAAQGAGLGAAIGAGGSESDLTKGDVEGFKRDVGQSAALGAPLGAAGSLVGAAAGKLGARFGARAGEVKAAKALKDAEEMLASRSGKYSQKVQDSNRAAINLKEALADPNVSESTKAGIRAFLGSPEGASLVEQVAANTLEEAPKKLAQMAALKAERAAAPADAAKQTADYFSKSTLKEDVLPRVKNYASRMIPQAVADTAGDLAGGAKGVAAGALGALSGAALGKPGTSLGNLLQKTPRFSAKLFETLASGSNTLEQALGAAWPIFSAQQTAEKRLEVLNKAMEENPEVAAKVEAALGQNQSKPQTYAERFGVKGNP